MGLTCSLAARVATGVSGGRLSITLRMAEPTTTPSATAATSATWDAREGDTTHENRSSSYMLRDVRAGSGPWRSACGESELSRPSPGCLASSGLPAWPSRCRSRLPAPYPSRHGSDPRTPTGLPATGLKRQPRTQGSDRTQRRNSGDRLLDALLSCEWPVSRTSCPCDTREADTVAEGPGAPRW